MTLSYKSILLGGVAIAMTATGGAFAQDATSAEDEARTEDTVIVIGERFGSGKSRATFTVGAEDIDRLVPGADVTSSLQRIPGVQVSTGDTRGGSFSFEIYLRGLSDEQIGLTVDGIPTGDSRFNGGTPPNRFLESSNLKRIAVSQSAGDIGAPSRFALGGFIDFVTADPKDDFGVTAEASLGSFDFQRVFARVDTGEIAPGLTGYFSYSNRENNIFAGENARSTSRDHFEAKLLKEFDNGSTVSFRTSFNDLADNDFNIITLDEFNNDPDSDRAGDVLTGVPSIDADFGGALGGTREDWLTYVNANFVIAEKIELSLNPYYHTLRGESFRYQDSQSILDGGDPRAVTGFDANGGAIRPNLTELEDPDTLGGPADLRVTPRDRDRYGLTGEIRFDDVAEINDLRAGFWYESSEANEDRNFFPINNSVQSIGFDNSNLQFVEYERDAEVETTFFYVQDTLSLLNDRLTIDAGLTYMDVSYQATSPLEYNTVVDFSQDSGINPKVAASYRVTDQVEIFAGYAQNFAGIPEDVFLGSTAAITPGTLDPVETDNFDIGLRWVGDDAAFSLQAYVVDLKNNIGIVPIDPSANDVPDIIRGNVATQAANIGGAETQGVEATVFKDFGDVDFYATYAYQDATHDDPSDASQIEALALTGIIGGERIRDIPEHSLFAEIGWEPVDNFRLATTVNYTGERTGAHFIVPDFCNAFFCFDDAGNGVNALSPLGTEELDAYTLVGLNAQYRFETEGAFDGVTVQLNVDNVFDEDFIGAVSGATATLPEFGAIGGQGRTLDRYFIGAPRTVTFTIKGEF